MKSKGINILSIDAKDLYLSNNYNEPNERGYNIRDSKGNVNTRKFINTLDYSLDLIKLRDVYKRIYRNNRFSFRQNGHEYSQSVINVTFKYSVKEFNKISYNIFVRRGYDFNKLEFEDNVCIKDGILVGIITNVEVENLIDNELLGKYFTIDTEKNCYLPKNMSSVVDVKELRKNLYNNGFVCDGVKYVRWKRSSGSARVGKCLFIDERLYKRMHNWEMAGLEINHGDEVDLAGLEAYISLPSSSIIGLIELHPENILLIDDYESVFEEDVIDTVLDGEWLDSHSDRVTIKNSIWDGQSLLDSSVFDEYGYSERGMVLMRNKFFKSCCFNTNIQKWFSDNNITKIKQLKGKTLATDISQIKLITTPSSIKYLKYSTFRQWLKNIDNQFGVVKYDKPTHLFDGEMVQCHYQLLNTLQMTSADVEEFLAPTFDYINKLRTDVAVVRQYVKFNKNGNDELDWVTCSNVSSSDIVYNMLAVNDDFKETKMYNRFVKDIVKSFVSNARQGHIYIHGNYSTLFGNPIEMLQQSIGKFKGKSQIGTGNIFNKNFEFNQILLGSRSPHISMCNVWTPFNRYNEEIDKYFNLSKQIICINSINECTLDILSGSDFDSDTVMLTDDKVLIRCALKNNGNFKVSTNNVPSIKRKRYYTPDEQADLDIKTGNNKIGEIVNLSMELNNLLWNRVNNGQTINENLDLYCDICKLNVASGIEIDRAKKEFTVDTYKELNKLREKYLIRDDNGRMIKPNFVAHIAKLKGYYDNTKKAYVKHDATMDYLQTAFRKYLYANRKLGYGGNENDLKPFTYIIDRGRYDGRNANDEQIKRIIDWLDDLFDYRKSLFTNNDCENPNIKSENMAIYREVKQEVCDRIANTKINSHTIVKLVKQIEKKTLSYQNLIMYVMFNRNNESMVNALKENHYDTSHLVRCDKCESDIEIYGLHYKHISKVIDINFKTS